MTIASIIEENIFFELVELPGMSRSLSNRLVNIYNYNQGKSDKLKKVWVDLVIEAEKANTFSNLPEVYKLLIEEEEK